MIMMMSWLKKQQQTVCAETEDCATLAFDTNQCFAYPVHNKGSYERETSKGYPLEQYLLKYIEMYRHQRCESILALNWCSNWYVDCQEVMQEVDEPNNDQIWSAFSIFLSYTVCFFQCIYMFSYMAMTLQHLSILPVWSLLAGVNKS